MKHKSFLIILLVLILTGGTYYYKNTTAVATITFDINPSIELSTNDSNKVVKYQALNEDGETLLENINLKNLTIDKATEIIFNKAIELSYINMDDEDNAILVTVLDADEEEQEEIGDLVETTITSLSKEKAMKVEVIKQGITVELKESALEYGISNGKMMYITKISNQYNFDIEELSSLSIKEINNKVKEVKGNPSVDNANEKSKVDMSDPDVRAEQKEIKDQEKTEKKASKNNVEDETITE